MIFRARQRLGAGVVEVSVERNAKQRFIALLDGYIPSNFTLDGSRDSITIRLKRVPKRQAAPPPESDSPYGTASNAEPNAATAPAPTVASEPTAAPAPTTAPAPTAAPAPESNTPVAPSPDVSSPEPSPE